MSNYTAWMRKNAQSVLGRLNIGSYCTICSRKAPQGIDLCAACEAQLTPLRHVDNVGTATLLCVTCGGVEPLPAEAHSSPSSIAALPSGIPDPIHDISGAHFECQRCRHSPAFLTRIIAPYRYEFPLDRLIQRMKYGNQRQLARVLGTLLARRVQSSVNRRDFPDVLIPVPMHENRQLQRGFNQASDIARWCALELHLPFADRGASRIADTDSLAGLSRAERQHAILGAFRSSAQVTDQRIAIIDDVLTTGSTARELARELYDTGARSVELWVLARTSSDRWVG